MQKIKYTAEFKEEAVRQVLTGDTLYSMKPRGWELGMACCNY